MAANWPVRRVRKKLYNLEAKEVSMVDVPANQKKILVLKAANMNGERLDDIKKAMASVDPEVIEAADEVVASFGRQDVAKAAPNAAEVAQGAQVSGEGGMSEEAQGALKAVARLLAPYIDQITDADMDALQESLGMRGSSEADKEPTDEPPPPAPPAPAPAPAVPPARAVAPARAPGARPAPQLRAVVRKSAKDKEEKDDDDKKGDESKKDDEAAKDADLTESEKKKYKARSGGAMSEDNKETVEKAASERLEAISKRYTALEEQNKELVAKLAKQEADLAVEREDRLKREYLARAREEFSNLDVQGVARILKSKHGDEEGLKEVEAVLKAANARVQAAEESGGGLFGEMGSRSGSTAGGGAQAKLDALVESTVQKSAGNKSPEQIYREVCKTPEGRRLYAQAEKEAGRGVHL